MRYAAYEAVINRKESTGVVGNCSLSTIVESEEDSQPEQRKDTCTDIYIEHAIPVAERPVWQGWPSL